MAYTTPDGMCALPGWGTCTDNSLSCNTCGTSECYHMGFRYEYPYVDSGLYNNDWLLNKMKELLCEMCKLRRDWLEFKQEMEAAWEAFQTQMRNEWEQYKNEMNTAWNAFQQDMINKWNAFQQQMMQIWNTWKTQIENEWAQYKNEMNATWAEFQQQMMQVWNTWKTQIENEWNTFQTTINQKIIQMQTEINNFKNDVPNLITQIVGEMKLEDPIWAAAASMSPSPYMLAMKGKKLYIITDLSNLPGTQPNLSAIGGDVHINYVTIDQAYQTWNSVIASINAYAPDYLMFIMGQSAFTGRLQISPEQYGGGVGTFDTKLKYILGNLSGIVKPVESIGICINDYGTSMNFVNPPAVYQAAIVRGAADVKRGHVIDLRGVAASDYFSVIFAHLHTSNLKTRWSKGEYAQDGLIVNINVATGEFTMSRNVFTEIAGTPTIPYSQSFDVYSEVTHYPHTVQIFDSFRNSWSITPMTWRNGMGIPWVYKDPTNNNDISCVIIWTVAPDSGSYTFPFYYKGMLNVAL